MSCATDTENFGLRSLEEVSKMTTRFAQGTATFASLVDECMTATTTNAPNMIVLIIATRFRFFRFSLGNFAPWIRVVVTDISWNPLGVEKNTEPRLVRHEMSVVSSEEQPMRWPCSGRKPRVFGMVAIVELSSWNRRCHSASSSHCVRRSFAYVAQSSVKPAAAQGLPTT